MISKHKCVLFLFVFLLGINISGQAQNLKLVPPRTELVKVDKDEQEGVVMTSYKYKSRHSKRGILKFYRLMFSNQEFSEIKAYPPKKDIYKLNYFFNKQAEGAVVLLNFLRLVDEGEITYYITTHHFSLEGEKEYFKSEPGS